MSTQASSKETNTKSVLDIDELGDDDDFIPDSLKGFLAEADKALQEHTEEVLNAGSSARKKKLPKPQDQIDEDGEEDDEFFEGILKGEGDKDLASDLLSGIRRQEETPSLDPSGHILSPPSRGLLEGKTKSKPDFLSPALSEMSSFTVDPKNPAAYLTASEAKRMATEGMTPMKSHQKPRGTKSRSEVRNLNPEMEATRNGSAQKSRDSNDSRQSESDRVPYSKRPISDEKANSASKLRPPGDLHPGALQKFSLPSAPPGSQNGSIASPPKVKSRHRNPQSKLPPSKLSVSKISKEVVSSEPSLHHDKTLPSFMRSTASQSRSRLKSMQTESVARHGPRPEEATGKTRSKAKLEEEKSARQKEAQERMLKRKREQKIKRERIKSKLEQTRQRRLRVEQQEKERVEKLKLKIALKDNRPARTVPPKPKRPPPKPVLPPIRKATPTIPVAPVFATDSRLHRKETPTREKARDVPLARSDETLKSFLRSSDASVQSRASAEPPRLTIPVGPKLQTTSRCGEKMPVALIPEVDEPKPNAWLGGLRSVSSPPPERDQKLTIPHTPKFQEIRKRALPKSTIEKEMEIIDYYKDHPFKAQPIRMNDVDTQPVPKKKEERKLTTPEPFHFRTDDRIERSHASSHDGKSGGDKIEQFRARPMPNFSKKSGHASNTSSRFKSVPLPNFIKEGGLVIHRSHRDDLSRGSVDPDPQVLFKAKPMPDFSKETPVSPPVPKATKPLTTPVPFKLRTDERPSRTPEPQDDPVREFHAMPMPNFSSAPRVRMRSPPRKSEQPQDIFKPFKARPLPKNLGTPSIPVRQRNFPSSAHSNSSPPIRQSRDPSPEKRSIKAFRARPVPKTLAEPSILPKPKRPSPPRKITRADPAPSNESPVQQFRAKALPKSHQKPTIPVRNRDPSKLRSPEKKAEGEPSSSFRFRARHVPDYSRLSITRDPSGVGTNQRLLRREPNGRSPPEASTRTRKTPILGQSHPVAKSTAAHSPRAISKMSQDTGKLNGVPTTITAGKVNKKPAETPETRRQLRKAAKEWAEEANSILDVNADDSDSNSVEKEPYFHHSHNHPASPNRTDRNDDTGDVSISTEALLAEEERKMREHEASERHRKSLQQAYDVQRAAEDELSYHGSSRITYNDVL